MEALFAAVDKLMRATPPKTLEQGDSIIDDIVKPEGGRQMYRCCKCGCIYIESERGKLDCFNSEGSNVSRDLFRGHT